MKKGLIALAALMLVSCAKKPVKVETVDYSLLDRIYKSVDEKDVKKIKALGTLEGRKVVKCPEYIKVYRGSFKDENGNVVEGGFELIRINDATPDTDF